jgi:hypothetical protein
VIQELQKTGTTIVINEDQLLKKVIEILGTDPAGIEYCS